MSKTNKTMTAEEFRRLITKLTPISTRTLAHAFGVSQATLNVWMNRGLPEHAKFANAVARELQKYVERKTNRLDINVILNATNLFTHVINCINVGICVVREDGYRCKNEAVFPTLLCDIHLTKLFNNQKLIDDNGKPITLDFMRKYTNWSPTRCVALDDLTKLRCKRRAVEGSLLCPYHKLVLSRRHELLAEIDGKEKLIGEFEQVLSTEIKLDIDNQEYEDEEEFVDEQYDELDRESKEE